MMTSMYMPQILNNMQHKLVNILMIMIFVVKIQFKVFKFSKLSWVVHFCGCMGSILVWVEWVAC